MADRDRWILHIKELREQHGVSIFDAERIALGAMGRAANKYWWSMSAYGVVPHSTQRRRGLDRTMQR